MMSLFLAVLTASLLGSLHCAGMCGAFVAIACGVTGRQHGSARGVVAVQAAYHSGRLISSSALGAAAGAAGSLINIAGSLAGLKTAALAIAGAGVATFGVISLLRACGAGIGRFNLPAGWTRIVSRLSGLAMNRPPLVRAALIGLLTTLLPCGWLYAFAVTAAGTGSPLVGALVMSAFWAGTVPALAAIGAGARRLAGPLARKLPVLTAAAMLVVGMWMFVGRTALDPVVMAKHVQLESPEHAHSQPPPCCVEKR